MNSVSFYGCHETAGSVADRISKSVRNETTGSIGYLNDVEQPNVPENSLSGDTVSFHGNDKKEKNGISAVGTILLTAGAAALIIAGLAYAHRSDVVGKMSEGKFKDFLSKGNKITSTCDNWCKSAQDFCKKGIDKIKGWFKK